MLEKYKKRIIHSTAAVLSCAVTAMSLVCVGARLPSVLSDQTQKLQLFAAGLAMPDGTINQNEEGTAAPSSSAPPATKNENSKNNKTETPTSAVSLPTTSDDEAAHEGEKKFPITECQYGPSGVQYDNFSIKNTTDYVINVGEELQAPLGFKMAKTSEPQVLIVHTHTCESYLTQDLGWYWENYYARNTDDNYNVTRVGAAIVDTLNSHGIGAVHAMEHHDEPTYNGAYDRSEDTIYKYLEKYPSIKVVIDLHRDAIGYGGEAGKIKPTFVANGKKAAQIMIMTGYDPTGAYGFSDWEYNLRFALRVQQTAESLYPGMTRPMHFGDFAYNMFINTGSLLIEVGTDVNTLEEAAYSGQLLGDVLAQVLKNAN